MTDHAVAVACLIREEEPQLSRLKVGRLSVRRVEPALARSTVVFAPSSWVAEMPLPRILHCTETRPRETLDPRQARTNFLPSSQSRSFRLPRCSSGAAPHNPAPPGVFAASTNENPSSPRWLIQRGYAVLLQLEPTLAIRCPSLQ